MKTKKEYLGPNTIVRERMLRATNNKMYKLIEEFAAWNGEEFSPEDGDFATVSPEETEQLRNDIENVQALARNLYNVMSNALDRDAEMITN